MCRLYTASLQGSGSEWSGNLASDPAQVLTGHTRFCCPPAWADLPPYLGAEIKKIKKN